MRSDWIDRLACPSCHGVLHLDPASAPRTARTGAPIAPLEIETGWLDCAGCAARYEIEGGIVDMAPALDVSSPPDAFMASEMARRDAEAPIYESLFIPARGEAEVDAATHALEPARGDIVLELGIGPARVARRYGPDVAGVLGVDLSLQSLRIARDTLRRLGVDACLVRADVCRLPVRSGSCSKALATQVLQHLPTAERRRDAVSETARALREGGLFVATLYHLSAAKRLRALLGLHHLTAREGVHSDGMVYYRSFTRPEARDLIASAFRDISVRGIAMQLGPWLHRDGPVARALEQFLQRTPVDRLLAHLLLTRARKR